MTLVTPSAFVSDWTANTLDQVAIHQQLAGLGVTIRLNTGVVAVQEGAMETNCTYTDTRGVFERDVVVMVTSRQSEDGLYLSRKEYQADWAEALAVALAGIFDVRLLKHCVECYGYPLAVRMHRGVGL